jgi:uncharacterized protein (DUF302 family)
MVEAPDVARRWFVIPEGMIVRESSVGPTETAERLAAAIAAHGMTLLAEIDHAGAAEKAGLSLRPTRVLMFGAARGGTPVMAAAQTAGIDLPLKALIWQDAEGRTWLGYNDPAWIAARHGLVAAGNPPIEATSDALAALALAATQG